ncbi:MAG TPA: hypothetical protein PK890_02600, partial [Terrimesophilobacter sp.]|nr:hypothetical protein [Terrimesophilobacter sp.]
AAAGSYRELQERLSWAGYVFVGIIVLFVLAVVVFKFVLHRSQARHMERPGDGDANTLENVGDAV